MQQSITETAGNGNTDANGAAKAAFETAECREVGDFDLIPVEIWGYQYKALLAAAAVIQQIGGDPDDTAEHILREFVMLDDVDMMVDLVADGVPEDIGAVWKPRLMELRAG